MCFKLNKGTENKFINFIVQKRFFPYIFTTLHGVIYIRLNNPFMSSISFQIFNPNFVIFPRKKKKVVVRFDYLYNC